MPRDQATLLDIVVACRRIEQFLQDADESSFRGDLKTQSAVMHQLLVIGEAATRLSDNFIVEQNQTPWRQIRGMRNHLIHGYDSVDLDEVWRTSTRDVPALRQALEPLLKSE